MRWFNLVLRAFKIPEEFISWFWMMYERLGIMIVINKYRSEVMKVERGFMEGHPPSMAAFVISMIPLMNNLEEVLTGIITPDEKKHKIKLFADDMKLFIRKEEEIKEAYEVIVRFEDVSGLDA